MTFNVFDFGARGDGVTDDSQAFQKALDEAGKTGGVVHVPAGRFRLDAPLVVPEGVALVGIMQSLHTTQLDKGSTLLATAGRGKPDDPALITLHTNSAIRGLAIHYPEQSPDEISPYPWTIRGDGTNVAILDLLIAMGQHPGDSQAPGRTDRCEPVGFGLEEAGGRVGVPLKEKRGTPGQPQPVHLVDLASAQALKGETSGIAQGRLEVGEEAEIPGFLGFQGLAQEFV